MIRYSHQPKCSPQCHWNEMSWQGSHGYVVRVHERRTWGMSNYHLGHQSSVDFFAGVCCRIGVDERDGLIDGKRNAFDRKRVLQPDSTSTITYRWWAESVVGMACRSNKTKACITFAIYLTNTRVMWSSTSSLQQCAVNKCKGAWSSRTCRGNCSKNMYDNTNTEFVQPAWAIQLLFILNKFQIRMTIRKHVVFPP